MKIKLAILEHDKNYLSRIITAFNNRFSDKLQVYSFTKADDVMYDTLHEAKIDVMLASDYFDIDFTRLPENCAFSYFVESMGIERYNDKNTICKYQKADIIYKEILNVFSEVASNISGTLLIDDSDTKVITFVSAGGGTGSSTMAAAFARSLALRGNKPLYLNLEILGNSNIFFKANGQFSFTDIIYAVKSKRANLVMKLESCVKQDESGVCFYDPCNLPLDLLEMNNDELISIISTLKSTNSYTHIIIDTDFTFDEKMKELFNFSSDIVLTADGREISNAKFDGFYKTLLVIEQQRDIRLTNKLHIVYNKFSNKTGKKLDEANIDVLGGVPKYEHAMTQQIVQQIASLDIFKKLE